MGEEERLRAFGACPGAMTEIFVAGMESEGLDVSPKAEACMADEIRARGPSLGEEFAAADEDPEAARQLAIEIVTPCQHLLTD